MKKKSCIVQDGSVRARGAAAMAVALHATGAAALLALPSIGAAQAFPAKPVRLVVAQAAGSATDVIARIFTPRWSELLGQPVVVDVRPGAGGSLGAEITAKSPNDGYTLLLANISTHGVNPALYAKLPYDPVKDFSPGPGSSQHLAAALLNTLMKIETTHVPYRGSPPALAGVVAGEIAYMVPTLTTALPQIQNGRVRAIAVTGPTREQEVPNIPTVAETIPGYDVVSWWGVVAPANTPRPAVDRLNADLVRTLAATDVKTGLLKVGMNASSTTPDQFAQYIRDEIAKWTKVAKAANIKLE